MSHVIECHVMRSVGATLQVVKSARLHDHAHLYLGMRIAYDTHSSHVIPWNRDVLMAAISGRAEEVRGQFIEAVLHDLAEYQHTLCPSDSELPDTCDSQWELIHEIVAKHACQFFIQRGRSESYCALNSEKWRLLKERASVRERLIMSGAPPGFDM